VPTISVIVCTYTPRRTPGLMRLIGALHAQTSPPAEIIVVVDHNSELLVQLQECLADVTVVANAGPRGLSAARNTGVATARGGVVSFIDDDAIPAPDLLERLAEGYEDPAVIGVGGAVEANWESTQPAWFPPEFGWVVGCGYEGLPRTASSIRNFIGCNMSFRADVFEKVGGFWNELGRIGTMPSGCEETEFCIRLSRAYPTAVLRFEPDATVRHEVPIERSTWRYFRSRCYSEGRSKALVAHVRGASQGLASERSYLASTVPRGLLEAVSRFFRGDSAGLSRAGAILVGVAFTVGGYLAGWLELSTTRRGTAMRGTATGIHRPVADLASAASTSQAAEERQS
jgi:O-antigen biosynthesis protein